MNQTGLPGPRAALRAPKVSSTPRRPVAMVTGRREQTRKQIFGRPNFRKGPVAGAGIRSLSGQVHQREPWQQVLTDGRSVVHLPCLVPGPKFLGPSGRRVLWLSPVLPTRARILATWWGLLLSSKFYISVFVITFNFLYYIHEHNVKSSLRIVIGIGQLTLMPPSRPKEKSLKICVLRFRVICKHFLF